MRIRFNTIVFGAAVALAPSVVLAQAAGVHSATLVEPDSATANISTAALMRLLESDSTMLLDTRPHLEWAVSHIPGARNVAPKPGMPASQYTSDVAEVGRLVQGDKSRPLVLYCNGPFCGKSRRVAADLLAAGYTNVRRYQLGAPVWRALGGVMVIEPDGARYVFAGDRTAVWLDARETAEFRRATLPGARHLPASGLRPGKDQGEVKAAKDDGRLPMDDHNTRIVVFGRDGRQARDVARALAGEAFHNVVWFDGSAEELLRAVSDSVALAADEAALRRLWADFEAAFNRGDAKAISRFFAPGADRLSGGREARGQAEIERQYDALIAARRADPSSRPLHADIAVRLIRPDVAILDGAWEGVRSGSAAHGRFVLFAIRQADAWRLEAARAWDLPPDAADSRR